MSINLKSILDRKHFKTLQCKWSSLAINEKNYLIPKSIDDLKEYEFLNEIKTSNSTYFFKEQTQAAFNFFVSEIYKIKLISDYLCYKSIQQAVKDEITKSFNSEIKRDFETSMNSILDDLNNKIDKHLFYFPLKGFILVDIEEISIGDVTLRAFSEKDQLAILERCNINDSNDPFTHCVQSCISENFIEKSTVIIPAYGDRDKAEQIAREKENIVINYFRFITCLLTHGRINENLVKISIESAWPTKNDPFFYELPDKNEICLANDRGRIPVENFRFDKGRLDDLTNNGYFIDVSEFVFKEEKT